MTLKHPMPTIRHNPQRSTINHNKLTNYPPQCIPHTYGCTIANTPTQTRWCGYQTPIALTNSTCFSLASGLVNTSAIILLVLRYSR